MRLQTSKTALRETREDVNKQLQSSQQLQVDNATLTATNVGLTSAQAALSTTNKELVVIIASLHEQLANSMSMRVFREVHKASATPVIEAIHAVNGRRTTVDGPPESQEDVVAFFTRLGWSGDEIQQFESAGVTGDVLLNDITVAMCQTFGVSVLHIRTLTRLLRKWNPEWGSNPDPS